MAGDMWEHPLSSDPLRGLRRSSERKDAMLGRAVTLTDGRTGQAWSRANTYCWWVVVDKPSFPGELRLARIGVHGDLHCDPDVYDARGVRVCAAVTS